MARRYQLIMNVETLKALSDLEQLGFRGRDVYLAELIPVVEMAWADGKIEPNEEALLQAYAEALTERLNEQCGAPLFRLDHTYRVLDQLRQRRLSPSERLVALRALKVWAGPGPTGAAMRAEMLSWAQAVAAVGGSPVWDSSELFWLQTMEQHLDSAD